MSFSQIRTFFEARLTEIDPDFQRIASPFNANEQDSNNSDKRFHLYYHETEGSALNQSVTKDNVSATVTLYFKADRDEYEKLDTAYDTANRFRIACMKKENLAGMTNFKRVTCGPMKADPVDGNDNMIRIVLRFSILAMFGTNSDLSA